MRLFCLLAAFALALGPTVAAAGEIRVGSLVISQPWLRMPPSGASTASGYLTITNLGTVADRLVAVGSDIAPVAQIHGMAVENGVAKMWQLSEGLEIPAGTTVTLEPRSLHIMFMHLNRPIELGAPVAVGLKFENAGKVEIEMPVVPMGAPAPTSGSANPDGASP